jgi:HTH-type transcriptional regulator/antitoxin HigA
MAKIDVDKALRDYRRMHDALAIGPIRTGRQYIRATRVLDAILDTIGNAGRHPLADLAEAIGLFIEDYEERYLELDDAAPADVLRFLMDQHALEPFDLREIEQQEVIAAILNGRRSISLKQMRRLAERFGVSPVVFL